MTRRPHKRPTRVNPAEIRAHIRGRRLAQRKSSIESPEELQRYYSRCALVLIGAAAGWISGHSMVQSFAERTRVSTKKRLISKGVNPKVVAGLTYILDEFEHIDAETFFSEHAEQISKIHEEYVDKEQGIGASSVALERNFHEACKQRSAVLLPPELQKLLDVCSHKLGLTQVERDVFAVALAVKVVRSSFSYFATDIRTFSPRLAAAVLEILTGHPAHEVLQVISPAGGLARMGIFDVDECLEGDHFGNFMSISDNFRRWVVTETAKTGPSYELLTRVGDSELNAEDFQHLHDELRLAQRLLHDAVEKKTCGINILFVGPPGTGKTEAAKVVSKTAGLDLYQVDFTEADGSLTALDAGDRMKSYALGQRLLANNGRGALIFDEMEDVLQEQGFFTPKGLARSKACTNSMLESNKVPTIWIANRLSFMDPAWLRRFSFVVRMPHPPRAVRQRILDRMMASLENKIRISEELKQRLLGVEGLSPGQLRVALKSVDSESYAMPDRVVDKELEIILREPLRIGLGLNGLPKVSRYDDYDPSFINSDGTDILRIVRALENQPRANILLAGPPGTGKTGFSHFVARQLGKPLLRKTAADLLDAYVGQTEKAIAAMFEEANRSDAVLLLDEVDGLLRDRGTAARRWEVTQVNELLSRMEDFNGIFICSTNHAAALDAAAMRRFLIKLEFGYLSPQQSLTLLENHLGAQLKAQEHADATEFFERNGRLTPADFSTVRGRLQFLGVIPDISTFLRELRSEIEAKLEEKTQKVGFR